MKTRLLKKVHDALKSIVSVTDKITYHNGDSGDEKV
tara:strand:- start:17 stop:124 length:108 start_codon:yes stop_codon:yes gene_type:complete